MTNLVPRSVVDEAEGEISPSASSTRDLGTRLVNDSNKSNVNELFVNSNYGSRRPLLRTVV